MAAGRDPYLFVEVQDGMRPRLAVSGRPVVIATGLGSSGPGCVCVGVGGYRGQSLGHFSGAAHLL